MENTEFENTGRCNIFFSFPRCQHRHRSSPVLIFSGYRVHSPWVKESRA